MVGDKVYHIDATLKEYQGETVGDELCYTMDTILLATMPNGEVKYFNQSIEEIESKFVRLE